MLPRTAVERGVALVLVLAMLVLITGLIVAFLQTVRTDLSSSVTYEKTTSTRLLAETALNLAIGQIQEATQRPGEDWVSQPGLIRTFDTSGNAAAAYKLYTDDQMRVDGAFDPAASEDLPTGGAADITDKPNEWVDLNEPITTTQFDNDGSQVEHFLYPIIDPRALNLVEGFESPTEDLKNADGSQAKYADGSDAKAILMPVKWLYLLKDGTLIPGVATGTGSTVTLVGQTKDNPSVARLAFWTDDETCKVNINTASEGTYSDLPPAATSPKTGMEKNYNSLPGYVPDRNADPFEFDIVYFQGAQQEYQRYPGHPATTSLSPVLFESIRRGLEGQNPNPLQGLTDPQIDVVILEEIYKIAPRTKGGSGTSYSGTVRPLTSSSLTGSTDRLYTSMDELLFGPTLSSAQRVENSIDSETLRRSLLERTKFFLTAQSRAPETNSFGKPRVSLWPVPLEEVKRTALDRLVAFCSTVDSGSSKLPFYFVRKNPFSPTEDFLLTNPQSGTQRNVQLYSYLQNLTQQPIPGFGGSFETKYGAAERDQILTQVFDFVRMINLRDNSEGTLAKAYSPSGGDRRGMVVPTMPPDGGPGEGTKGFGRFPTLSELAISIIGLRSLTERTTGIADDTTTELQMALIPELFSPAQGYPFAAVNMRLEFDDLDKIRLDGQQVFANSKRQIVCAKTPSGTDEQAIGGYQGYIFFTDMKNPNLPNEPDKIYPTGNIIVNGRYEDSRLIQLGAADIKVRIYAVDPTSDPSNPVEHLLQESVLSIPPTSLRIPKKYGRYSLDAGKPLYPPYDFLLFENSEDFQTGTNPDGSPIYQRRNYGGRLSSRHPVFSSNDWMRSLAPVPACNDFRLVAGVKDFTALYAPHPRWNSGNNGLNHSLTRGREQNDFNPGGRYVNMLAPGISLTTYARPDVLPPASGPYLGVLNADNRPGDWDNGVGLVGDGPMINKPDEGELPQKDGNKIPYIGQGSEFQIFTEQPATYFSPNRLVTKDQRQIQHRQADPRHGLGEPDSRDGGGGERERSAGCICGGHSDLYL